MSRVEDMKGRVKEAAGDLTDNEELEREGKKDQMAASLKDKVEDAEEKVEDIIDKGRDRI